MNKEEKLVLLSRIETKMYRLGGIHKEGKFKHEPIKYRSTLEKIYSKLPQKDIDMLLKLKEYYNAEIINN